MPSDQYTISESTGYWITRLARSMERDFEKRLEPLGITRGAFAVLSTIYREKITRPAELAAFLGIDGAAVTRHLDRLEKGGLIERKSGTADRRSTHIELTAKGRGTVRSGHSRSSATNEKFTAGLSPEEIERFKAVVRTMLANTGAAVKDI